MSVSQGAKRTSEHTTYQRGQQAALSPTVAPSQSFGSFSNGEVLTLMETCTSKNNLILCSNLSCLIEA